MVYAVRFSRSDDSMRAIQRINHNAAICEDGAGRQLIALGRGIGFGDMPHEVDLDVITRTFYGIDKDIAKLADILGHSSIDTTRIYIIYTGTEHRRRMENMRLII